MDEIDKKVLIQFFASVKCMLPLRPLILKLKDMHNDFYRWIKLTPS
jgi:hypothetical protein